jgi:hypothetical protein
MAVKASQAVVAGSRGATPSEPGCSSNLQPEIGKREVKDREMDLTREPEMVKWGGPLG